MVRCLVPSDLVDPTQERDPSRDSVSDLDSDPKKSAGLENQFLAEAPIDKLMPGWVGGKNKSQYVKVLSSDRDQSIALEL